MPDYYLYPLFLSLGVFIALWPVSVALKDVSIVDAWWGPGFLGAAALVWFLTDAEGARTTLTLLLVGVWALRLGVVLIRRRLRHGAEDNRYVSMRQSWGAGFWWKSLFIVFVLQGALQWVIVFPAMAIITAEVTPIGVIGWIGVTLAVLGFALETRADAELDAFKATAGPGDLLDAGLRKHMRHPNYTGEMIFWWGVWLIAVDAGAWWTVFAPLTLTFLLTKVSGAGITGGHLKESKPAFRDYAARTPAFLPKLG